MREEDTPKSDLTDSEYNNQFANNKKYFDFFEHAPVALFIEDFSKVKNYVEKEALKSNTDLQTYLDNNLDVLGNLHSLVIIKEVNETAVKLYNAESKADLLENLEKVFTKKSYKGFSKLVFDILCGKKQTIVETVNKTLQCDIINLSIKYNVEAGSEQSLENVIVSVEDITERVRINKALEVSEKRYKESQEVAKIASWFYDYNTQELFWSNEIYTMLNLDSDNTKLSLDFYLSFVDDDDINKISDFSINYLLQNPNQNLNYRIKTSKGELKYIYEKRSVIIQNEKILRIVGTCQDVTDRVLSEIKLSTTKKLLSNTLSSIKDGFVILDKNGNYLYVNKVATKLLGKSESDLIGKHIWSEFPEDKGDIFYDNYQLAVKTNKPMSFENYFAPWNRWFENRIIPSNGTMLMFFHEITEIKETENKIKEAYNIINKSSSIAILCKNSWDFLVVFASENAEKLFGYSSTDFLAQQIKIHELVHPDDLNYIRNYFFVLLKKGALNSVKPKAFRIITKTGEVKWIETSLDIIKNSKNEITHIQGIARDITERKKTEDLFFKSNQRLQDQFNNTPLASIIWDLDFKVLEWNNSSQRIFGYSEEEAKGKNAIDLIIPPTIENDINSIWKSLLNQESGYRNRNENITKTGEIINCDWYNVALKDVEGNVIGVASLVDDITERVKSKVLLESSEKKYRDIFEKSIDAVLILKDGVFVDCNKSTLKMFGFENKESLFSLHPSKISPEKQPDGSNSFLKAEEFMQIAKEKGSSRFRWYHQHKNGHVFPAEVTLTKIEENDNKTTIHAVLIDITERVKIEEIEKTLYNISKAALKIDDFSEFGYIIKKELHKIIDTNNFFIALYNEEKDSFYTPVMVDEMEDISEFPAEGTLTGYVIKAKKSLLFTNESHAKLIESGEVGLVGIDSEIWLGVPLKTQNKVFGAIVVQSYSNRNAYSENDVKLLEFVADQISSSIHRKNTDFELKKAMIKAQESDRLKLPK